VSALLRAASPRAIAWLLAALLPGFALQCWRGEPALLPRLALALAAALLFETLALRARRQPLWPFLAEGSAFACAGLLVAWLPALEGWRLVLSIFHRAGARAAAVWRTRREPVPSGDGRRRLRTAAPVGAGVRGTVRSLAGCRLAARRPAAARLAHHAMAGPAWIAHGALLASLFWRVARCCYWIHAGSSPRASCSPIR
jgi:hypothetical protein